MPWAWRGLRVFLAALMVLATLMRAAAVAVMPLPLPLMLPVSGNEPYDLIAAERGDQQFLCSAAPHTADDSTSGRNGTLPWPPSSCLFCLLCASVHGSALGPEQAPSPDHAIPLLVMASALPSDVDHVMPRPDYTQPLPRAPPRT